MGALAVPLQGLLLLRGTVFRTGDTSRQELASRRLGAKSGLLPVCVNNALLGHTHIHFYVICGYCHITVAEESSCD